MKSLPCAILLLTGAANLHAATISSSADTYIQSSASGTNFGATISMIANNNNSNDRIALFSFDLLQFGGSPFTSAKLQLQDVAGNVNGTFQVWGLAESFDNINESTLNWANAGFLVGASPGATIDSTKAYGGAMLGTFANTQNSVNTVFDVTSGNFLNFLNADTDGIVTFAIVDPSNATTGSGWATKEHTTALKPTLTLETVPEPSAALLGGIGLLALLRRRRQA